MKILIADDNALFARSFAHSLNARGFETRVTGNCHEAKELIQFWYPDFVFIDLLLPGKYAVSILKFIHSRGINKKPKIIVMSKQSVPEEIEAVKRAGAFHYLVKPFRMRQALQVMNPEFSVANRLFKPESDAKASLKSLHSETLTELHILDLFLRQVRVGGEQSQVLFNLMRMIGLRVGALRCSLVQCLNSDTGVVMASNDDEAVRGHSVDLSKYPEIGEVRNRQRPLIIANIKSAEIMAPVRGKLAGTPFESMAIFPVYCKGCFYGTLSLRLEQRTRKEMLFISKFGQICAQIISLRLSSTASEIAVGA